HGTFSSYQAEFKAPTRRFEDISFTINVASSSVHTGSGKKDKIVRGNHFFWVEKYPSINFASKRIIADPGSPLKFGMEGDFTIRGITKPVTLHLTVDAQGDRHAHLYGDLSFDRREFGMTYNMPFNRISDSVRVWFDLDVQGTTVAGSSAAYAKVIGGSESARSLHPAAEPARPLRSAQSLVKPIL